MFAFTNNDKLSVTLNLKHPVGVAVAGRLVARADAVVENFTPGTLGRLGLGYEELSAVNPGLVMLSTCNQGQTGPHSRHAGFGTHLTSLSGFTNLTGWPDRAPSLLFGPYIDYVAVGFGVMLVLAALDSRRRTGRGCRIDLSQYETGVQFLAPALVDHSDSGRVAGRAGNSDPEAAPHGVYRCRGDERWCALSVHDDAEWSRLAGVMGRPAWALEPGLSTPEGRKLADEDLDRQLDAWTSGLDRDQLVERLREAGIHAAAVYDMADLHSDPDLAARLWHLVDHSVIGPYAAEGPPYVLSETPARLRRGAPLLGQHTEHVLCELLGMPRDDFERLEASGALQ